MKVFSFFFHVFFFQLDPSSSGSLFLLGSRPFQSWPYLPFLIWRPSFVQGLPPPLFCLECFLKGFSLFFHVLALHLKGIRHFTLFFSLFLSLCSFCAFPSSVPLSSCWCLHLHNTVFLHVSSAVFSFFGCCFFASLCPSISSYSRSRWKHPAVSHSSIFPYPLLCMGRNYGLDIPLIISGFLQQKEIFLTYHKEDNHLQLHSIN